MQKEPLIVQNKLNFILQDNKSFQRIMGK